VIAIQAMEGATGGDSTVGFVEWMMFSVPFCRCHCSAGLGIVHLRPHARTPARPHARTPARPHARTPARPHARTPASRRSA
jgi:hypothetical protein